MKTKHHSTLSAAEAESRDRIISSACAIRGRWWAVALSGFLFTSIFALSPSPVDAQCNQWNVGHYWLFDQGAGNSPTKVVLDLHQNGTVITGTAVHFISDKVSGSVDGTVEGDQFAVHIYWDNNTVGVYEGTIRPSGRIEGKGYNQATPRIKVNWHSETAMVCADAAPVKPDAAPPTAPAPPVSAKPAGPNAGDWVGRWDTTTDQGGHFELVLTQDGDAITGIFRDLNGNPQYNGTLIGTLSGKTLKYRFTQLKSAGLGEFSIANAGQTISGEGWMNDADKTHFAWWGFKTK